MKKEQSPRWNQRKIPPPPYKPKFQRGERVKISPLGIRSELAAEGTMGTVEACTLAVLVLIDGTESPHYYWPEFWERPLLK